MGGGSPTKGWRWGEREAEAIFGRLFWPEENHLHALPPGFQMLMLTTGEMKLDHNWLWFRRTICSMRKWADLRRRVLRWASSCYRSVPIPVPVTSMCKYQYVLIILTHVCHVFSHHVSTIVLSNQIEGVGVVYQWLLNSLLSRWWRDMSSPSTASTEQ